MFPYVMIVSSLVFFSGGFHEKLLSWLPFYKGRQYEAFNAPYRFSNQSMVAYLMAIYIFFQLIIPFRFLLYPGHLFWTEEGYRFSWRVMLMEKSGAAYFTVKDKQTHQSAEVNNAEFLTALQEKMMSTQPDLILKYAHFLAEQYKKRGFTTPEVYGEIYVALNGKHSTLFVDSTVNLAEQKLNWGHYQWLIPYKK